MPSARRARDPQQVVFKTRLAAATAAVNNPLIRNALQEELDLILPKLASCLTQVSDHEVVLNEATAFDVTGEAIPQHLVRRRTQS